MCETSKYRKIMQMSHSIKLWKRVIEYRLIRCINICKNQFGFYAWTIYHERYSSDMTTREILLGGKGFKHNFFNLDKAYGKV